MESKSKLKKFKAIKATDQSKIIKKAAFVDINKPYKMCSRCVMDTTDPDISFDANNVCNHCQYFDSFISSKLFDNKEKGEKIKKIVNKIKSYGKNKKYDCIIGLSGGVDSSYVAT